MSAYSTTAALDSILASFGHFVKRVSVFFFVILQGLEDIQEDTYKVEAAANYYKDVKNSVHKQHIIFAYDNQDKRTNCCR